jgi:large subunit ribosomal protein L4
MAEIKVLSKDGQETGSIELSDDIFNVEIKEHLVHMAVVHYLNNQRQGTKATKTRAEVRGGGRKPWRQKGTGNARHGSKSSPIWKGGGVTFAHKPRDFSTKMNKKVKRYALKSVLTSKFADEKLVVLEDFQLDDIKTKEAIKVLDNINANNALIVIGEDEKNAYYSLRNIEGVQTANVNIINVYDILKYDKLVVTKDSVLKMQEVYA